MQTLPSIPCKAASQFAILEGASGGFWLELQTNGHLLVHALTAEAAEEYDAGSVLEGDEKALSLGCSGENIIVQLETSVKVFHPGCSLYS